MKKNKPEKKSAPSPQSDKNQAKPILLITGMHRSGTSALTGVLSRLGASDPKNPVEANEFNSRGYNESRAVMQLNEEILNSAESGWTDLSEIKNEDLRRLKSKHFDDRILQVINEEFPSNQIAAVKDPRICRIADFWSSSLQQDNNFTPNYIFCLRHPMEVAESLNHRDRMNLERGLGLWLRYNLDGEFQTRGHNRCFVHYENLLRDWEAEVARINQQLEINPLKITSAAKTKVNQYLSKDLRHHESEDDGIVSSHEMFSLSLEVYKLLISATKDKPLNEKAKGRLDKLRRQFNFAGRVFHPLLSKTEQFARGLNQNISSLKVQSDEFKTEAHKNIAELKKHLLEQKKSLESSEQKIGYMQKQIVATNRRRAKLGEILQSTIEAGESKEAVHLKSIQHLNEVISELKNEHQGSVKQYEMDIAELKSERQERLKQYESDVSQLKEEQQRNIEQYKRHTSKLENEYHENVKRYESQIRSLQDDFASSKQSTRQLEAMRNEVLYLQNEVERFSNINADLSETKRLLARENSKRLNEQAEEISRLSKLQPATVKPKLPKPNISSENTGSSALQVEDENRLRLNDGQKALLSEGFVESHYLLQCKELDLPANTNLVEHYLETGASLDLSPHPLFDPVWYKKRYSDLSGLGNEAYLHFLEYGSDESRSPCPVFDTTYYNHLYPDVLASNVLPHIHYYRSGWREGRNPSAWFYSNWYLENNISAKQDGICPLVHYMQIGESLGFRPHPSFEPNWYQGEYLDSDKTISPLGHFLETSQNLNIPTNAEAAAFSDSDRPVILAVAHSATGHLFGSERSFLDVVTSIDRSKYSVIVALPNPDPEYVKQLSKQVDAVHFTKKIWWESRKGMAESLISQYGNLIKTHQVDAVYVNTIMLREPLEAARRFNLPGICHIREAITHDPDLIKAIGKPADEIIKDVVARSDFVVGNSNATLEIFGNPDNSFLIYNAIKIEDFDQIDNKRDDETFRFGMLSSNLPKKGIADVVDLAKLTAEKGFDVEFHLIGPETDETERLRKVVKRHNLTNVVFRGYISDVVDAISTIDAVLNFSHFAESFGRTIAEGGAAGLPSIVYDHGALPEVVDHETTGYVIPYRKPEMALEYIEKMIQSREFTKSLGQASRQRAKDLFSYEVLGEKINSMFDAVFESRPKSSSYKQKPSEFDKTLNLQSYKKRNAPSGFKNKTASVSVIVPNYNYAEYLEERLGSIFYQTVSPAQIIFLDDASSDDSVSVAEELLSKQDIPYQIIASEENSGVYNQWVKGFEAATEDWVWIAEADDRCEPDFIEKLLTLADDDTNIVYAESQRIDGNGDVTADDNRAHSRDVSATRWSESYKELGVREVVDALCFRNTIPNASAALLRRSSLHNAKSVLSGLQYTGDWKLYSHLLRSGNIAYCADSLNHFRRHEKSVTRIRGKSLDYLEELANIREYLCTHFPIREEDMDRMDWYLNRDYRIEKVEKNTQVGAILPLLERSRHQAAGRKRFGFITTNNGSHYGGSEMLWRETAMALREKGHDVFAVIKKWDPRPEFFDEMERAGIKLLFKSEDGFADLVRYKPDLVIVSLGDQDEGIEFYPDLKDASIPYAIVNQLTKEARFWAIRKEKTKAVKKGYSEAKQTFFTCWNNQRVMQDRLGSKLKNSSLHFNPYHIDRSVVPDWPSDDDTQIAIPSKLLFIHKGQDILTEFLGKEEWKSRNITFNFYGSGPDEQNLRDLAKQEGIESFRLHGRVADISDIWKSNHALLMPSRMEGLPIMLVSAMLSGRVPILTDIGGHAEVVSDNKSGFIASDPDPEAVEDALKRAIEQRADWEKIGQLARQQILDFLPENPVKDFIEKLEKIA